MDTGVLLWFCEFFKNTFFTEQFRATDSVLAIQQKQGQMKTTFTVFAKNKIDVWKIDGGWIDVWIMCGKFVEKLDDG